MGSQTIIFYFPNCSLIFEMESVSFSNANLIPLSNGYTFICSSFFNCFKAVLCALLKLSCYFLPIITDKILLTVCRRFSADVFFLLDSNFNACDSMAVIISIYGIDFGVRTKFGPKFNKEVTFLSTV